MIEIWAACVYRSLGRYTPSVVDLLQKTLDLGDWKAEVTIGAIPEFVTDAKAIHYALSPGILSYLNSRPDGANPVGDESIKAKIDSYMLPSDWRDNLSVYTTIVIRKTLDIPDNVDSSSNYLWYDMRNIDESVWAAERETQSGEAFERVRWYLLERLNADILGIQMERPRAHLVLSGGSPWPVPHHSKGSSSSVAFKSRLGGEPFTALSGKDDVPKKPSTVVRISRFALDQFAEADAFKRFLWCYAGIELAADAIYKSQKDKAKAALRFDADGDLAVGLAVTELIWPDKDAPEAPRSIKFRFALMALLLSPSTSNVDVETFKKICDYRNGIHGQLSQLQAPPVEETAELFMRYYPLIMGVLRD